MITMVSSEVFWLTWNVVLTVLMVIPYFVYRVGKPGGLWHAFLRPFSDEDNQLLDCILEKLVSTGVDLTRLTIEDLAPIEKFHNQTFDAVISMHAAMNIKDRKML